MGNKIHTQKFDINSITSYLIYAKTDSLAVLRLVLTISVLDYEMQCLYLPADNDDAFPLCSDTLLTQANKRLSRAQ